MPPGRGHAVVAFLPKPGMSRGVAELDTEGLEHHLSAETLAAMRGFVGGGGPD